jgi:hypothetical protein
MNMKTGTWNIRSLYKGGSVITVAGEITKHESKK